MKITIKRLDLQNAPAQHVTFEDTQPGLNAIAIAVGTILFPGCPVYREAPPGYDYDAEITEGALIMILRGIKEMLPPYNSIGLSVSYRGAYAYPDTNGPADTLFFGVDDEPK